MSDFMLGGGSERGRAPVYCHRDDQLVPSETPYYYVSFGPSAPKWIHGPDGGDPIGSVSDRGIHERVEARLGPEYERFVGRRVHVGDVELAERAVSFLESELAGSEVHDDVGALRDGLHE